MRLAFWEVGDRFRLERIQIGALVGHDQKTLRRVMNHVMRMRARLVDLVRAACSRQLQELDRRINAAIIS